jgi:flavodoxin
MHNLIVVYSYHHGNTKKIAEIMAKEINAQIAEINEDGTAGIKEFADYDLVGFGAGIDSGHHYSQLLQYAEQLPHIDGKKVFIFSTAGIYSEKKMNKDHKKLREILQDKGFNIVGEFSCLGLDTNSVLKLFGGLNKGRPNDEDLHNAKTFAQSLL